MPRRCAERAHLGFAQTRRAASPTSAHESRDQLVDGLLDGEASTGHPHNGSRWLENHAGVAATSFAVDVCSETVWPSR